MSLRSLLSSSVLLVCLSCLGLGCVTAGQVKVETTTPGADVYVDGRRIPVGQTPVVIDTAAGFYGTPAARVDVIDEEGRRVTFDVFRREVTWRAIYLAGFSFGGAALVLAGAAALALQTGFSLVAVGPAVAIPGSAVALVALLMIPVLPVFAALNVFASEGEVMVDMDQGTVTGQPAEVLTTPLFWLGPPDASPPDEAEGADESGAPPPPMGGGDAPPSGPQGY